MHEGDGYDPGVFWPKSVVAALTCTHTVCKQAINRGYPFGSPFHLSFFLRLAPMVRHTTLLLNLKPVRVGWLGRDCPFLYIDVGDPRVAVALHPVGQAAIVLYCRYSSLTVRRTDDTGIFTSRRCGSPGLPPSVTTSTSSPLVRHAPISGEWELRMTRDDTIGPK